jgi:hypothetical protein
MDQTECQWQTRNQERKQMLEHQRRLRRANPVWFEVRTWIGCFWTEDRVTWRSEDGAWVAQLQRSINGSYVYLTVWHSGQYVGRHDAAGWHAATGRSRPRTPRPVQRTLPLAS